ncbi:MAG TPA: TolC family protein [Candidatus Sulfotelmatobacter sp.]|nr:TolC family protein [Candidatus Sulfotelmatobacter sp.]
MDKSHACRQAGLPVVLAVLLLLTCQAVSALTWQDVVAQAAQKNNEIRSARKQLDAFQWTYYKSYSNFLPQVSANASMGNSSGASGSSTSNSYGLSASQSLFSGLGNYFNTRSAAVNYDFYRANLQNTEADAYYQARQAFIDLLIAQQNVAVREQISQVRADSARMIKLFYDSGTEDKGNYLLTQVQLADAKNNLVSAKRQLELARLKLAQLIDGDVSSAEGTLVAAAPPLPDIDALTKNAPAFLMAGDQLELAGLNQQATISEFLPSISLNASYQKSGSSWPPDATSKSLSLNVSLPIFPGGSNLADRVISGLQLDKAREDFAKSEKDLYFTVKQAYENLNNAIDNYAVQKQYLDASAEQAKITQQKYLNGLTTYYEWNQIQNTYINNQIGLLNADQSALNAEANWYKSYGGYLK